MALILDSPSISSVRPFFIFGPAIKSAEINWLEIEPEIWVVPPTAFPFTVTGGLPSVDVHCTPSYSSASRSGCIGLFFRLESPVSVIILSERDEIAVEILIVVPEFDASIS